jgi:HemY protein
MKMLLIALATLFVAVIVSLLAMEDPGYVLIAVGEWTVETTLALTVVIVLLSFTILYYSIRAGLGVLAVPGSLRHWQKQRLEHKAIKSLTSGLIDLAEGQWQAAEKKVIKHVKSSDASLLNYLAAARAAQAQGADQRRDHYLKLALENHPSADIAVGLTQAELQLNQHQLEQALATLRHLHQLSPKHPQVLKALAGLYQNLGDWEHLLEIIPLLRKHKAMSEDIIADLSQQTYLKLLQAPNLYSELSAIWTRIPESFRESEVLLTVYVRQLLKMGESDLAEPLLRHALRRQFSETLLMLYGKIESAEPARQLALVESLLVEHERDAIALLTAGRLCLRNKLWGKARSYLEASVNAQPNIEAYNELGKLLERMGESAAAAECFREGLSLVPGCEQTTPINMALSANPVIALSNQTIIESEMAVRKNIAGIDATDFGKSE